MDQAHGAIKNRILRGEVRLGETISRRKVATELGMSFLPVTLALLRLEYEGFVESRPRAGTRVRIPSRDDIRGHYVVREALEVQAARLFVANATKKDIEELRKKAVQLDSVKPAERHKFLLAHQRFHKRIADIGRCPTLATTIEQVLTLESTWLCAGDPAAQPPPSPTFHQDLVDALASGDQDSAVDGVRRHIGVGVDRLMQRLKPFFVRRNGAFVRKSSADQ
jgi:DNA-binding GntR family transcriptional regulator